MIVFRMTYRDEDGNIHCIVEHRNGPAEAIEAFNHFKSEGVSVVECVLFNLKGEKLTVLI